MMLRVIDSNGKLSTEKIFHCAIIDSNGKEWFLTLIQGPPYPNEKNDFWDRIKELGLTIMKPWIIASDSNETLERHEKWGRKNLNSKKDKICLDALNELILCDLGSNGPAFTWTNKRKGLAHIKERLDRIVANNEWIMLFPEATINVLTVRGSDDSHILLSTNPRSSKLVRPFRFCKMWFREEECELLIKSKWKKNEEGFILIT